jgi:hypothetical protein
LNSPITLSKNLSCFIPTALVFQKSRGPVDSNGYFNLVNMGSWSELETAVGQFEGKKIVHIADEYVEAYAKSCAGGM